MGKMPWEVIRRNITGGAKVACRVPTQHLIVTGVSNWGAYGLAAGVYALRKLPLPQGLFEADREQELLRLMVERGSLVDGVTAKPTATVDGLSFAEYAAPMRQIRQLLEAVTMTAPRN